MTKSNHNSTYDVVIIGAGISGLVCGCYLAKTGLKVLIVEQHFKPGGYCTSFSRNGYTFDAAAHSFGGYRQGGIIHRIFDDLDLHARIKITRFDPSDIVTSADYTIGFWSSIDRTIEDLQRAFPSEATSIAKFHNFITHGIPAEFAGLRTKTFADLLNTFFSDKKLHALISLPVLGNGDLPPSLISAFVATKIYREFLLDGGYYPDGGMQAIPDILAQRFKEFGGILLLSTPVDKICTLNKTVTGVLLENSDFIPARVVISNGDARQTFFKMLEREVSGDQFLDKLNKMHPSQSIFILYLGLETSFHELPMPGVNYWHLPNYDVDNLYHLSRSQGSNKLADYYMARVSPDKRTILAFVNTPYKDKQHWQRNKTQFIDNFVAAIERNSIPSLTQHIAYKNAATPATLFRYTRNHDGAAYGWAGLVTQFADREMMSPSWIKGLFLTGHWTTYGQGIAGVAYVGDTVAKLVLKHLTN